MKQLLKDCKQYLALQEWKKKYVRRISKLFFDNILVIKKASLTLGRTPYSKRFFLIFFQGNFLSAPAVFSGCMHIP